MTKTIFCLFLLNLSLLAQEETTTQSLFEKVFKRNQISITKIPVFIQGQIKEELLARIENSEKLLEVEKQGLFKVLNDYLSPKKFNQLNDKYRNSKFIEVTGLRTEGVELLYNLQLLILEMKINTKFLKTQRVDLAFNQKPEWVKDPVGSRGVSGFINFYNYYQNKESSNTEETFTADQNYNLNWKRFSLFAQTSYESEDLHEFTRQDIRLTYDRPEKLIRFQGGDLKYQVNQYQSFIPTAGLLMSTNFDLNPYRLYGPQNNQEIYLETPSRVRVYVNKILVRTIKMPAGTHRIDQLPLSEGLNDVTLEILDNNGREEKITFKKFTSYNLIGKGVQQFSYALGVPSYFDEGIRHYDTKERKYFYLLNHNWGIRENLNLGYGLTGTRQQNLTSIRSKWQNRVGYSQIDFARSQLFKNEFGEKGKGFASKFTHQFSSRNSNARAQRFQMSLEYLSPYFTPSGRTSLETDAIVTPEASYNRFLTDKLSVRLSARYRYLSKSKQDSFYNVSVGLTSLLFKKYQLSSQYSYSEFKGGENEHQVLLSLNYSLSDLGHFFATTYNSAPNEGTFNWAYNKNNRPNQWNSNVNIVKGENKERYDAKVGTTRQWFQAGVGYEDSDGKNAVDSRRISGQFHSALAYAGGKFALSKPIGESFSLINTKEALNDVELKLNNNDDSYDATTRPFGRAVVNNSQAYRYYPLRIDTRNVPIGVESPKNDYAVYAPFRGGVYIELMAKKNRALVGKLFFNKKPEKFVIGRLISKKTKQEIDFFTNRKGRFLIESVEPGKYSVYIDANKIGEVVIPEDGDGFVFWENKR